MSWRSYSIEFCILNPGISLRLICDNYLCERLALTQSLLNFWRLWVSQRLY